MKFIGIIALLVSFSVLSSCRKDAVSAPDSLLFMQGLTNGNPEQVEIEMNKFFHSMGRTAGSSADLNRVTKAVSDKFKVRATTLCYNCIYTNPPQSEIGVWQGLTADSPRKIIDITWDDNGFRPNQSGMLFSIDHS